ncbi:MAG: glycosyltransferase family 4 protein, partial [Planctomycetota bacterium JB042]
MRLLHTFSNWKWTGPAEPAVRLAARLAERHDVSFACGRCPYPDLENRVASAARAAGLPLLDDLVLKKHFDLLNGARDLRRLTATLRDGAFDVVHTHLLNDHLLAGAAARRDGTPLVFRTVYGGRDLTSPIRRRLAFGRFT